MYSFNEVFNLDNLENSARECIKTTKWKSSSKKFEENFIYNLTNLHNKLHRYEDMRLPFIYVQLNERGKSRNLKTIRLKERIIHKCLVKNCIYPLFTKELIYDNYAAQEGKGYDLSIKRLKYFINSHLSNNEDGVILLIDVKSYYESISHDLLFKIVDEKIKDKEVNRITKQFISSYDEGLGLGSEMNQILAINFLSPIDHYIKEELKCKYYGRYMDDSYVICKDKKEAKELLEKIVFKYNELGLQVNLKKTKICNLKNFKWLQNRISVYGKDNIKIKPRNNYMKKQRHKIRAYKNLYLEEKMTIEEIINSYQSWRNNTRYRNCNKQYEQMDNYFFEVFKEILDKKYTYYMYDGKIILEERTLE